MWSKKLSESLPVEGACYGVWNPLYLSKQHTALGLKVLGKGGKRSFDISGTTLMDNHGSVDLIS